MNVKYKYLIMFDLDVWLKNNIYMIKTIKVI